MPVTDDDGLRGLLGAETVAVVGCSTTAGKAAHEVPAYLADSGYEIVPINPFADEVLGVAAYDSLNDVPSETEIDLVDVFRPSEEVPEIVDETVDRRETVGDVWGVWLQQGIEHDEAAAVAEAGGLTVTQDRCLKIEHRRLL